MNICLLPEAVEEANSAALWYEKRHRDLGNEFIAELQSGLATIKQRSHGMAALESYSGSHDIRRHLINRFPYMVIFAYHADKCVIVAVAHVRRRPLYWLNRLH